MRQSATPSSALANHLLPSVTVAATGMQSLQFVDVPGPNLRSNANINLLVNYAGVSATSQFRFGVAEMHRHVLVRHIASWLMLLVTFGCQESISALAVSTPFIWVDLFHGIIVWFFLSAQQLLLLLARFARLLRRHFQGRQDSRVMFVTDNPPMFLLLLLH
jgi:hypothetical protein